jgi:hypothetical protein
MNATLVIIDAQPGFFSRLSESVYQRIEAAILSEIKFAKETGDGVIVAEYDMKQAGGTVESIVAALEDYERKLFFEHSNKALGEEALAVISQQSFYRPCIRLCGLYRSGSVAMTAEQISYCTNFQVKVEIAESGSADLPRIVSE